MQVVDFGGGELVIYTGTSSGALCRLRLQIPLAPGAQPDQIQVARQPRCVGARSETVNYDER